MMNPQPEGESALSALWRVTKRTSSAVWTKQILPRWEKHRALQAENRERRLLERDSQRAFERKLDQAERLARAEARGKDILLIHKSIALDDARQISRGIRGLNSRINSLDFFSKLWGSAGSAMLTTEAATRGHFEQSLGILPEYGQQLINRTGDALITLGFLATHAIDRYSGITDITPTFEIVRHQVGNVISPDKVGPAVAIGGVVAIICGLIQRFQIRDTATKIGELRHERAEIMNGFAT